MLTYTELSNEYVTNNEKQVKTFIKKHSSILDYVHELTPLINRYFPNNKNNNRTHLFYRRNKWNK